VAKEPHAKDPHAKEPHGTKDPHAKEPHAESPRAEREASVKESGHVDKPTQQQLDHEIDHIADNPHLIEGKPPERKVEIGEHTWRENETGGWCRYSTDPTSCVSPGTIGKDAKVAEPPKLPKEPEAKPPASTEAKPKEPSKAPEKPKKESAKAKKEAKRADLEKDKQEALDKLNARLKEIDGKKAELKKLEGKVGPEEARMRAQLEKDVKELENAQSGSAREYVKKDTAIKDMDAGKVDVEAKYKGDITKADYKDLPDESRARADELLAERDSWRAKRDAKGVTEAEKNKAISEVNKRSEALGELAGEAHVRTTFPGPPEPTKLHPLEGAEAAGSGQFDQIWQVTTKDGQTKTVVVEAKGKAAEFEKTLDSAMAGAERVQQGTRPYYDRTVLAMQNSSNKAVREAGEKLAAMKPEEVEKVVQYLHVHFGMELDAAGKSVSTGITIGEFDLARIIKKP
jgi:hypothetical protein